MPSVPEIEVKLKRRETCPFCGSKMVTAPGATQRSEVGSSPLVRPLTSLEEWNKRKADTHRARNTYPQPNGIACPRCGEEMNDLDAMMLASNPPQRNIGCPKCGHRTYRMA